VGQTAFIFWPGPSQITLQRLFYSTYHNTTRQLSHLVCLHTTNSDSTRIIIHTTFTMAQHAGLDPKYDSHLDFPTVAPTAQSGHPGHTTKEQDAAVHQLRSMLEAEGYKERLDTLTMLRFLRARKFQVEASKQM
jgi:hypothetical protein